MSRKKRNLLITLVLIIILIGIAACSSSLMLRVAVFPYSPASAFTMKYKVVKNESDNIKLYNITKNAPIERGTEGKLTTWAVYSFGPFHYAKYYGDA